MEVGEGDARSTSPSRAGSSGFSPLYERADYCLVYHAVM